MAAKRNYGIDLLRVFSMSMVIMLHTLSRSKLLDIDETTLRYAFVWFLEIFCYCAVDCFVLISGYVGVRSRFRISRIVLLWVQVFFYNVLFEVLHQVHTAQFDFLRLIKVCFPVTMKAYWFFTCYFLLSLFMPFINKLLLSLTARQRWVFAALLFLCYSAVPMLMGSPLPVIGNRTVEYVSTKGGYSVIWLCIMYTYGAILRLNLDETPVALSGPKMTAGYLLCCLITWGMWCGRIHCTAFSGKAWYMVSYTAPLVVLAGVCLLFAFMRLPVSKMLHPVIDVLSSSAFAVYLIHSNGRVYGHYVDAVAPLVRMDGRDLLLWLPVVIIIVYLGCTAIDQLRGLLFRICGIDKLIRKLDDCIWIQRLTNNL